MRVSFDIVVSALKSCLIYVCCKFLQMIFTGLPLPLRFGILIVRVETLKQVLLYLICGSKVFSESSIYYLLRNNDFHLAFFINHLLFYANNKIYNFLKVQKRIDCFKLSVYKRNFSINLLNLIARYRCFYQSLLNEDVYIALKFIYPMQVFSQLRRKRSADGVVYSVASFGYLQPLAMSWVLNLGTWGHKTISHTQVDFCHSASVENSYTLIVQ